MAEPVQNESHRLKSALIDATLAALVAFALFSLTLGVRTVDSAGGLTLKARPALLATAVGIVFAGRLLLNLFWWNGTWKAPRFKQWLPAWPIPNVADYGKNYGGAALVVAAVLFPIITYVLDAAFNLDLPLRYLFDLSILVLTYVMLGFGLNIVVGLAGLLDLGYVAFYAVGAYTFALLAAHFGLGFWLCLPLAGLLAALWGVVLGFPVLRLARRLSRHRHARLRRDRPHRAAQLDRSDQRPERHLRHPEADLLRPRLQADRRAYLRRASSASATTRSTASYFSIT